MKGDSMNTPDLSNRHGGPSDRGSADAYYWRAASPHKFEGGTYTGPRVELAHPEEVTAYMDAYHSQTDRKDYD